ncbi:MAG: hypothetical protein IKS18_03405 [Lachnospiraceae bacterium]|nr:hypothetical protein [Lachnospiraceae bacterium]
MSNRIEQVIGDIEEYIDGCKMQAFSNTKIIVDRPQLEEFLDELRQYTPEEVKKYQRMLNNRDKILSDAKKKASEIEDKAQAYAEHMVNENQITRMAYEKANEILKDAQDQAREILDNATDEAGAIRQGALDYTNAMLDNLHTIISGTVEDSQNRYTALLSSLSEHLNIIEQNQRELNQKEPEEKIPANSQPFFETDADEEDEEDL